MNIMSRSDDPTVFPTMLHLRIDTVENTRLVSPLLSSCVPLPPAIASSWPSHICSLCDITSARRRPMGSGLGVDTGSVLMHFKLLHDFRIHRVCENGGRVVYAQGLHGAGVNDLISENNRVFLPWQYDNDN